MFFILKIEKNIDFLAFPNISYFLHINKKML